VFRRDLRPFTEAEARMLQTFADQAVIAIQNARLFNDTKEALERQTATAEILKVISGSPTSTQPVFDAIVASLLRLFGTQFAAVQLAREGRIEMAAVGGKAGFEKLVEQFPRPLDDRNIGGLVMLSRQTRQFLALDDPAAPAETRRFAREFGFNSVLFAPMVRDGQVIGAIGTAHPDAKVFDDKEVALIESFADQAVIAIENVRLFNETREALERQTATADILRVISASPTDVQPVFEAIAERARVLCNAVVSGVTRLDGNMVHLAAYHGVSPEADEAMRSVFPVPADGTTITARAIRDRAPVQIADVLADPEYGAKDAARLAGYRSNLAVPLLRDGQVIGSIAVCRAEVGAFPDKQVALLQTFADQAVIAIQNARLFRETNEALARQTASADILRVISRSPTDVKPVFDAIVEAAVRLLACDFTIIMSSDGRTYSPVSGATREGPMLDMGLPNQPVDPAANFPSRAIVAKTMLHLPDWSAIELPPHAQLIYDTLGVRSALYLPLLRGDACIGLLVFGVKKPRQFSAEEVAVAESFRDQALIAIENTRLFNETREALERQTATAEVLKVIGSSVADTAPVFNKILASCESLFPGAFANIGLIGDDGLVRLLFNSERLAQASPEDQAKVARLLSEFPRPARHSIYGYAVHKNRVLHYPDVLNGADVPVGLRESAMTLGNYAVLYAPLTWEGRGIGALAVNRIPPAPFSERDINQIKTFADQAVIAIQNAKLFRETNEALERQTATTEVLQVISGSVADAKPVFEKILDSCARLIPSDGRAVLVVDDQQQVEVGAVHGDTDGMFRRAYPRPIERTVLGLAFDSRRPLYYPEARTAEGVPDVVRRFAHKSGFDSVLVAPMIWEDRRIGCISIARHATFAFSNKDIDLLQSFADQGVIAIQNARLFRETNEALASQTASAEILRVMSRSLTDVRPVFEAIVANAVKLLMCDSAFVMRRDG
ncbi:MAG: GAF domain-containing protein, partial [Betaproteobacteria bacterium]